MDLMEVMAKDLALPVGLINEALSHSYRLVKLIKIVKKDGGERRVYQPTRKVKVLQYWLINNLFSELAVHSSALAFRKELSIKDNARRHQNGLYFVKLDFENFFPSIKFEDLWPLVTEWYSRRDRSWALDKRAKDVLKKTCFDRNGRLVMGYPSSPVISNAVMFAFDTQVFSMLVQNEERFGKTTYTRYADDIVVSTTKPGVSTQLFKEMVKLVAANQSPKIKIHPDKTSFRSRPGGSAFLTGLRICQDGHVTVHRKYKVHIRLLLSLAKKKKLKPDEYKAILGHLYYLRDVDPVFFTHLHSKYFATINEIKNFNALFGV